MSEKRVYIIAGEASGDLHGSNLMRAMRKAQPKLKFRVWGGELMEAQGGELVKHYREMSFMGFWEVFIHLRTILGLMKHCKADLLAWKPDVVVLVDYPGFNLRMARFCKENGIRVMYYISPQVWAWHRKRVFKIKKYVDQMISILPFEKAFFKNYGVETAYVGHPLLDVLAGYPFATREAFFEKHGLDQNKKIIAMLPGSRRGELEKILPKMMQASDHMEGYQWVVAGVADLKDNYQGIDARVKVVFSDTYNVLKHAEVALVASGTATLETALIGTPQVVCYEISAFTYMIARHMVKVKFISLVNLIMDKEVIRELIQSEFNVENTRNELKKLMVPANREKMLSEYVALREVLGGKGASERAAQVILDHLK